MKYLLAILLKVLGMFAIVTTIKVQTTIEVIILLVGAFMAFAIEFAINRSTKDGSIIFPEDILK